MRKRFSGFRRLDGSRSAMVVRDGRIVEVGPDAGPGDEEHDLGGKWLMPGFVDAHCHVLPTGLDLAKPNLRSCGTREEVMDAVRDAHAHSPAGEWLHCVHYDQTRFPDGRHLTRAELDAVSADRPILLRHSNGHASVANSAALSAAGVADDTPDPAGGAYVRGEDGRPNGVLLEQAHERVSSAMPEPSFEQMIDAILLAGERMADLGVTAATDMMTGRWDLEKELQAYDAASRRGCRVRLRMYLQWGQVFGSRGLARERLQEIVGGMDHARCKAAGVKIFADGAIGSATAAIYGQYLTTGGDGQLIYPPDRLKEMVRRADAEGWPIAVHTIGDRSTDLVMDAYDETADPKRHRMEHVMLLSDAQIARMAAQGARVTMQPEFLLRFGHSYAKQLGAERAATIKRARSVLEAGIRLSFNSDRPIVPGDPWDGIRAAVDRPAGFDPSEAVPLATAIDLYTRAGAEANDDAGEMGELAPGQWADFQVYEELPGIQGPVATWVAGER